MMDAYSRTWTLREEIALKRRTRNSREAAHCTFQPVLISRQERSTTGKSIGCRFIRLYDDAIRRMTDKTGSLISGGVADDPIKIVSSVEDCDQQVFLDSMVGTSGSVALNLNGTSSEPHGFQLNKTKWGSNITKSTTLTAKNLHFLESRQRRQCLLGKYKSEANVRLPGNCTFTPEMSGMRSSFCSKSIASTHVSVESRLLEYGVIKKKRLEWKQSLKAKEMVADLTFIPTINRSKVSTASPLQQERTDVYRRLSSPADKKNQALLAELDSELTFQPKLRRASIASVQGGEVVNDRLFREAEQRRKEFEEQMHVLRSAEHAKYSYIPTIPQYSGGNQNEEASVDSQGTPVYERLYGSQKHMYSIFEEIRHDLEMSQCTFQPNLTAMGRNATRRASEGPVHERLDKDAQLKRKESERRLQDRHDAELLIFTFQPHFETNSKKNPRRKNSDPENSRNEIRRHSDMQRRRLSMPNMISTSSLVVSSDSSVRRIDSIHSIQENQSSTKKASEDLTIPEIAMVESDSTGDSQEIVGHSHLDLGPVQEPEFQRTLEPKPQSGTKSELNCAAIETQYPFSLSETSSDVIPDGNQISKLVTPTNERECCDDPSTAHLCTSPVRRPFYSCGDESNCSSPLGEKNGHLTLMSPRSISCNSLSPPNPNWHHDKDGNYALSTSTSRVLDFGGTNLDLPPKNSTDEKQPIGFDKIAWA